MLHVPLLVCLCHRVPGGKEEDAVARRLPRADALPGAVSPAACQVAGLTPASGPGSEAALCSVPASTTSGPVQALGPGSCPPAPRGGEQPWGRDLCHSSLSCDRGPRGKPGSSPERVVSGRHCCCWATVPCWSWRVARPRPESCQGEPWAVTGRRVLLLVGGQRRVGSRGHHPPSWQAWSRPAAWTPRCTWAAPGGPGLARPCTRLHWPSTPRCGHIRQLGLLPLTSLIQGARAISKWEKGQWWD